MADARELLEWYADAFFDGSGRAEPDGAQLHSVLDALRAVLDKHSALRIYDECGHRHTRDDVTAGVAKHVENVGFVCEDGFEYTVCRECCTGGSGYQSVECADDHLLPCHPCATVQAITDALAGGRDG